MYTCSFLGLVQQLTNLTVPVKCGLLLFRNFAFSNSIPYTFCSEDI